MTKLGTKPFEPLSVGSVGIGIGVAALIFILTYKEEEAEKVVFTCSAWEAPIGGDDCEKCNADPYKPCSEYRCKSLGQACQLLNEGMGNESCVWVNPRDVTSPTIAPWEDALTLGHSYTDVKSRPPGIGMRVVQDGVFDGCVKPFTPLEFGISTNEPTQCKIDYNHTDKFDNMAYNFGNTPLYLYNHSQKMSLPGPANINAEYPELQDDGVYTLYARCQDANGNYNEDEFAIRFCVQKGPDTTPPKIEETSILNGFPIQYDLNETQLDVYVNEPAECRWARLDKSYENLENQMTCQTSITEMNNRLLYKCSTTLTGLENRKDNVYYFRCKDQPSAPEEDRNDNKESYVFTLIGTQPLNIIDVGPNESIKGYATTVPVTMTIETANGYSQGDAICYYSLTQNEEDYIRFFDTTTNEHEQRQDLPAGTYTYYFKCVDLGGNTAYSDTTFTVIVDQQAPLVIRQYYEAGVSSICGSAGCLKILTDEESSCSYSLVNCNFDIADGTEMPYANTTEHFAEWKPEQTYYMRCQDVSGNQPLPTKCSIVVKPYTIS